MTRRSDAAPRRRRAADAAPSDESADATDPYVLEKQVGHLLRRAHQRASAIFAELIGESRLTPVQYAALVKIHDLGSVTQNRLGRLTAMDPATVKGVVARLRQRGLIARTRDPADRRRVLWRLTPEGSALVARAVANGRRITEATLAPLDARQRARFLALLERLG